MRLSVRRDTWCRHRTPFTDDHPTCKVGVNFHQFKPADYEREPMVRARDGSLMPCLGESDAAKSRCPKYSGWTAEEIAAREADMQARLERIGTIREAIVKAVKNSGQRAGVIECPACKTGKVRYSQASSNGHIHAACSTDGCASWME